MVLEKFNPMLCEEAKLEQVEQGLFDDDVWIAQKKHDGIRAYVCMGKMYSRRGDDITAKFPEFAEFIKSTTRKTAEFGMVFDGEIVADTGEFNDVAGRIHLRDKLFIKIASISNPCTFKVFDAIRGDASTEVWTTRDATMRIRFALKECDNVEPIDSPSLPSDLLKKAKAEGWEGIVLKKKKSLYYTGRSMDWRKVKLFKEAQHSFTSYVDHPKGVLLQDGERKVNVNGKEAEVVRNLINNKGKVVVEVQFLPQNNNDKWRFPSFRGIVKEVVN